MWLSFKILCFTLMICNITAMKGILKGFSNLFRTDDNTSPEDYNGGNFGECSWNPSSSYTDTENYGECAWHPNTSNVAGSSTYGYDELNRNESTSTWTGNTDYQLAGIIEGEEMPQSERSLIEFQRILDANAHNNSIMATDAMRSLACACRGHCSASRMNKKTNIGLSPEVRIVKCKCQRRQTDNGQARTIKYEFYIIVAHWNSALYDIERHTISDVQQINAAETINPDDWETVK